jgi:ribonucleoside-triphosphate reductase
MTTTLSALRIKKRDGTVVGHDSSRITVAVFKAMNEVGVGDHDAAIEISRLVTEELMNRLSANPARFADDDHDFTVEKIQDLVEVMLMRSSLEPVAKAYILYRSSRAARRAKTGIIPAHLREKVDASKLHFRNPLAEFVYFRSYSRWIEDEQRRETWIETVERYMSFMREKLGEKLTEAEYAEVKSAILDMDVMPSMRLMWSAGDAARASNVTAYNCSFIAPTCIRDFGEIVYLLMCGTGVGYSVEHHTVYQLPQVKRSSGLHHGTHVIGDSKEGWADALIAGMEAWYAGDDIDFDYSELRAAGARLKTMGGKSSGPEPLRKLLEFARMKIRARAGRHLTPLEVSDIICMIGDAVVAGGVRRSALICLSDLDDHDMRHAKGEADWRKNHPHRQNANISAVYESKPNAVEFLNEWTALIASHSGERGIFNRGGLTFQIPERRRKTFMQYLETCGTNPCGEITLRNKQFCNLTEGVVRSTDTRESLKNKIRIAAILGTYQSTLTDFSYLSDEWKKNCEEERLLGVSLTGQWDNITLINDPELLRELRDHAIAVNAEYAARFGVNPSTAVTCVKPSGTVSLLADTSSGMHARFAPYYIRRIEINATDSLFKMLRDQGVPYVPKWGQTMENATTFLIEFPVKAPEGSTVRHDVAASDQLEHWLLLKKNFTEHNPSVTIDVAPDEWIETANWVYTNWDSVGGLSFLPRDDTVYTLAPFEACTQEVYEHMLARWASVDFAKIVGYEREDETQGSRQFACVGNSCELA